MDLGIADYRKTILYSTYDVTKLLKRGGNTVGAMICNSAYLLKMDPF